MKIYYNEKKDLLYIRFEEGKREVVNRRVTDDIVLDMEEDDKIIGMEVLDASKRLNLRNILPITYDLHLKESAGAVGEIGNNP
ncbi:MAG: DUF2283 domain-containing protein [Desulfobacteraceae bacterium]